MTFLVIIFFFCLKFRLDFFVHINLIHADLDAQRQEEYWLPRTYGVL